MSVQQKLLTILGDADTHSGTAIADSLGVSRAAIWKHLQQLRELGVEVDAEAGQGYRLKQAYEPLDASLIRERLSSSVRNAIGSLNVQWECDSTNNVVLDQLQHSPVPAGVSAVCLTEMQTAGRGRRGRQWQSPPGGGIWLSLSWTWDVVPADMSALSLSIGAAVLRVLQQHDVPDLSLKWPNDVLVADSKLGGILVDIQGDLSGPLTIVVGVGLNVNVSALTREQVKEAGGQPPIGLADCLASVSRNAVVADLLNKFVQVLREYAVKGFAADRAFWQQHDYLLGKPVAITGRDNSKGVAGGVTADGYLIVRTSEGEQRVGSGDVSVRPVTEEGAQ